MTIEYPSLYHMRVGYKKSGWGEFVEVGAYPTVSFPSDMGVKVLYGTMMVEDKEEALEVMGKVEGILEAKSGFEDVEELKGALEELGFRVVIGEMPYHHLHLARLVIQGS